MIASLAQISILSLRYKILSLSVDLDTSTGKTHHVLQVSVHIVPAMLQLSLSKGTEVSCMLKRMNCTSVKKMVL
jgi:hypothetical protein